MNMNIMNMQIKRMISAVSIYGEKRFKGEKRREDWARFSEMQYPLRRGAPIWIYFEVPSFMKKDVSFYLVLYWSRKSYKLMFRLTCFYSYKLRKVRASSIDDMLEHCNCEVASEKEHSVFYVSKLVQRSSFKVQGKMMNCDSMVSFGLMPEKGILQHYHLLLLSFATTILLTGKTQLCSSSDLAIGVQQYLTPLLYPLAFQSQYPPSCILISLPPGTVQKLTTSSVKWLVVCYLISWYILFWGS